MHDINEAICVPECFLFFLSHLENETLMRDLELTCNQKKYPSRRLTLVIRFLFFTIFRHLGNRETLRFHLVCGSSDKPLIFEEYRPLAWSVIINHVSVKKKKHPSDTSANTSVGRRLDLFSVNKREKRLNTQSRGSFVSSVGAHTFQKLEETLKNKSGDQWKHGDIVLASIFWLQVSRKLFKVISDQRKLLLEASSVIYIYIFCLNTLSFTISTQFHQS